MTEADDGPAPTARGEFLRRRNGLWARLRLLSPDDPAAEAVMEELMALTHQTRQQVLAGLGWDEEGA